MPAIAGTPQLTISALLQQPSLISRALVNLAYKRLIADRLFVDGGEAVGGGFRYQELESIFVDDDPMELSEGADFPITDWSEALKTANVRGFGFGVRITNYMIRRRQMDMVVRAERKLANRIVKYIDTIAMATLVDTTTYTAIQTQSASAAWGTASTDVIGDIAAAQQKLEVKDNGYAGFDGATLVLNTAQRASLLNNTALRTALPRETQNGQIQSGMVAPFLGLKEILFTPQLASNKAVLLDAGIAGTIQDERPDASEGFVGYDPGAGFKPIYVKVEKVGSPQVHSAVYCGRWPAIALVQPDAVVVISGV